MSNKEYARRKKMKKFESNVTLDKKHLHRKKQLLVSIGVIFILIISVSSIKILDPSTFGGNSSTTALPSVEHEFKLIPKTNVWFDKGKLVVDYLARQGCPFSATESWSLYLALSDFGNFSGISYLHSNVADYNHTAGINYLESSYSSPRVQLNVIYVSSFYNYSKNGWQWFQTPNNTLLKYWFSLNPGNVSPLLVIGGVYESLRFPFDPPTQLQNAQGPYVMSQLKNSSVQYLPQLKSLASNISQVINILLNSKASLQSSYGGGESFCMFINEITEVRVGR